MKGHRKDCRSLFSPPTPTARFSFTLLGVGREHCAYSGWGHCVLPHWLYAGPLMGLGRTLPSFVCPNVLQVDSVDSIL